jgi:hypothetical protein
LANRKLLSPLFCVAAAIKPLMGGDVGRLGSVFTSKNFLHPVPKLATSATAAMLKNIFFMMLYLW